MARLKCYSCGRTIEGGVTYLPSSHQYQCLKCYERYLEEKYIAKGITVIRCKICERIIKSGEMRFRKGKENTCMGCYETSIDNPKYEEPIDNRFDILDL